MDCDQLIETLHIYERKVLIVLDKVNTLPEISQKTGLSEIEAMRGLQWLQNKGIVQLSDDAKEIVDLDVNGKEYLKNDLPERRFLNALIKHSPACIPISAIIQKTGLTQEEVGVCLGVLKGKTKTRIKNCQYPFFHKVNIFRKKLFWKNLFLKKSFRLN